MKTRNYITGAVVAFLLPGLLLGTNAFAQENEEDSKAGYEVLAGGVDHDRLFAVDFAGGTGVAVGELGQVMRTADGGGSWQRSKAPTDLALLGVAMSGERRIVVGQEGLILIREGDGDWRRVDSGTKERLLQVDMNESGLAYAVGAFGTVLRSTDFGESWQSAPPDWESIAASGDGGGSATGAAGQPTIYDVQVEPDGTLFLAGELSYLLRSPDAGDSWDVVYRGDTMEQGVDPTMFALKVREGGIGYAVGQSGAALRTSDGGRTWTRLETPGDANLFALTTRADGVLTIVGMRRTLRSEDGGQSWTILRGLDLETDWYSDVAIPGEGTEGPLAVGHAGRIVRLTE